MREVRLRFSKEGRLKYISHLDVNRVFTRALRRAGIPIWYTEGYNPHPYMSFSLPLPLGVESLCECVDIRINGDIDNKAIMDSLNSVLPRDMKILKVYDDFHDCNEIAYSDYVFKIIFKDSNAALDKIKQVFGGSEIIALKKSKQGRKKVMRPADIKPLIDRYNISVRDDVVVLNARLAAGNRKNLNPILLFDTVLDQANLDYEWKNISRISLLDKNYKEFI